MHCHDKEKLMHKGRFLPVSHALNKILFTFLPVWQEIYIYLLSSSCDHRSDGLQMMRRKITL